jgi:hypothetical protein
MFPDQTQSFQNLWQFHFQEGSKEVNPKEKKQIESQK